MLEGVKIVEMATHIAAPGAAGLLARWGADVIKIESPAGDPMRRDFEKLSPSGTSPIFEMDNRGKRSVVLDIHQPEDRERALALIGGADVFITNMRVAVLRRLGLDHASLAADHPKLIHASVTGFGSSGPDADLPGYDVAAFWARSGVAALMTPKDVEHFPIRTGMGDHVCSLSTVSAILAALYSREKTGVGRQIEASLLRSGTFAISSDLTIFKRLGRIKSTRQRRHSAVPLVNFFRSGDGKWFCLMPRNTATDWPAIAAAADCAKLVDDPRFATPQMRAENVEALIDALDAGFARQAMSAIVQRLRDADLVFAPVQTPWDLESDPQAAAAGVFETGIDATGERFEAIAAPVDLGIDFAERRVPALGEHSVDIIAALDAEPRWPAA